LKEKNNEKQTPNSVRDIIILFKFFIKKLRKITKFLKTIYCKKFIKKQQSKSINCQKTAVPPIVIDCFDINHKVHFK